MKLIDYAKHVFGKPRLVDISNEIEIFENKNDICSEIEELCKKQCELKSKLKELKTHELIDRFSRNEFVAGDNVTVKNNYAFMFNDIVNAYNFEELIYGLKCNIAGGYDIKFTIENIYEVDGLIYLQSNAFYINVYINKIKNINNINRYFDMPIIIPSKFIEARIEDNNITVKC